MRVKSLRTLMLSIAAAQVASYGTALAQDWPKRTVSVIVPNPPGVAMDVIARLFAERQSAKWGQAVVVENLPGGDGINAAREFAAKRDDHTLLYSFAGLITISPLEVKTLPYDPGLDLVPIASTSDNYLGIAVPGSLGVSSLAELAQFAKTNPGKLNWAATPGLPLYAFAAFQKIVGAEMVRVPYGNFMPAVIDLGEGRIGAVASGIAPLLAQTKTGKVKTLAVLNRQRTPLLPQTPTAAEAGFPSLTFAAVTGYFGWRNMPERIRERIAADVRDITAEAKISERMSQIGATTLSSSPAEFTALIEEQRVRVANIFRDMGSKQ